MDFKKIRKTALLRNLMISIPLALIFSGCSIIFGGSKYNAHVEVIGDQDVSIIYKEQFRGKGTAKFLVKRNDADKVLIKLNKEGFEEKIYYFKTKKPRPFAVYEKVSDIISVALALGSSGTISIPLVTLLNFATGAYYKPDVKDQRISKINYDNFKYSLEFPGNQ